jgi:predicted P-loop ATPase
VVKHSVRQQQDPLSKDGLIGAFCRTYFPITEAIHTFLSDVYAPSATEGRYDYIPADSNAGVVIYDDKFVYSHHATDPACEKLLNAFDLVRIHLFGDDDPKKTYKQMCDLALQQDAVKLTLDRERRERADEDFAADDDRDWTSQLRYQPRSQILENSVWNLMLILNNDPDFANFGYNELANRVQVTGPVPWDRPADNKFWRDADTAQLKALLDTRYVSFSSRNHDVCFAKVADDRRFHPIRDYLDSLPPWDGECRVESLFIRCLEADDTEYVRTVTRRLFAAAVARVYQPGIKFDCLTVIDGAQGIGKSTLLKELVGDEYYSETLSLTDMDDKTGAEKLQGYWVIEIGELAGMKKADVEKVKGFLSTTDDKYRPSYGRVVESHPRQCVVIATVNGERGYLRDITGNRRFWIIKCRQKEQARKWSFTKEERDQIWAEAVALWRGGEKLYLEDTELPAAEALQREAMELDERQGIVEEYLNTLLPDNWDGMDLYERRNYLSVQYDPTQPRGTTVRKAVSNVEIWAECFGKNPSEMKPADSYAIAALMMRVEGWERTEKIKRIPVYGRQRLYLKTE